VIKKLILPQSIQRNKNTQRTHQSQFPQRFSFGVLFRKTTVSFPSGKIRKGYCSRKTESILPAGELLFSSRSHSFRFFQNRKTVPVRAPRYFPEQYPFLIGIFLSKDRARSVSEVFFWTVLLVHFVDERTCPLSLRGFFYERYPRAFKSNSQDFYEDHINNFMILGEVG